MESQELHETETEAETDERAHLAFRIGEERYLLDVEHVIEVIRVPKIQPLPDVAPFMAGVINLRGQVIPVIDLSLRFGTEPAIRPERRVVVVVEYEGQPVGVIVDRVEQVRAISTAQIERDAIGRPRVVSGLYGDADNVSSVLDVATLVAECRQDIRPEGAKP